MRSKHFSLVLYRWLLKLYPATFRETYADALERQFRDEIAESTGLVALATFWIRLLFDIATSVPVQFAREVIQDVRHSFRLWARHPMQTGFAIAALAIGIGANIGVFSVVNALLLRSLPFRDPSRLVMLRAFFAPHESAKQFHDWRLQSSYLEDAAFFDDGDVNLGGVREAARAHLAETSWNFFSTLGIQPVLGRAFSSQEDTPGHGGVAVIGYGLWQQIFGGDPTALGSTIHVNGVPLIVIGIAPAGFDYPERAALWTPATFEQGRIPKNWQTIARIIAGTSLLQAREAFAADADHLNPNRRKVDKEGRAGRFPPRMARLQDELVGPVKSASLILMAGVVVILLIACTNVANLLLARTADRATELSLRSALGASRLRLSQQLLTESILLSLVSSSAGFLVAHWTVSIIAKAQPSPIAAQAYSILDGHVLSFAIAITVVSGLIFGALPSLYGTRMHALGNRSSSVSARSGGVRELLIAVQVMLTVILLASSVSIGRAFVNLMGLNRGFEGQGLVTASVSLAGTTHELGDHPLQYFEEAVTRVRELPEVRGASVTEFLPLAATAFLGAPFTVDGQPAAEFSMVVPVLSDYFQTMGGRMIYGREFTEAEVRSDAQVAIVNDLFAQQFGGPSAVLGRELRAGASNPRRIIGVVKGMIYLGDYNRTQIFFPDHTPGRFYVTIVARVNGRAEDHISRVRDAIKSVDPQVPLYAVKTMEERLADSLARPKFYSTAVLLFAAFALLLAVMGIYGTVSYGIAQRTHEMGVRLALGTTPRKLREVLLRQGLLTVAAGAILGIGGAILSGRYLESLIDGAKSVNVIACAATVFFIGLVAATGIWAATRRIARLDVMDILRSA